MDDNCCEFYACKPCNYETDRKFNYQLHLDTKKHKELAEFKCDSISVRYIKTSYKIV